MTLIVPVRHGSGLLVAIAAIAACGERSAMINGRWVGDLRGPGAGQRLEVSIDSARTGTTVSLTGSVFQNASATILSDGDSLALVAVAGTDTIRLRGTVRSGVWRGEVHRDTLAGSFELQQLFEYSDTEWKAITGTYRSQDGRLLGIAPFSEFGSLPLVVDYTSGRIGPLYPVAQGRLLIGHSLISPVLPADTLELQRGPSGEIAGVRLMQRGQGAVVAARVPTREEPLQFSNGPVTLSGTLTLPVGPPPHPALVLVHGSNALTRDVFGPWSRFFVGLGFAVLSFDKRGTGASTGDWKQADFAGLGADVLAGVRALAGRPDIRADRIGLWGASQAGWIMPLVAAQAPTAIAFMVVHAGSGTTVREEGVLYIRNELRFAGLPEASVQVGTRYQELDDAVSESGSGFPELQRYYEEQSKIEPWLWPPRPADDWFRPYYRMLMNFDPAPSWRRVRCPVLFFFGELDANVPPAESWPPIERALRDGGNTGATQVLLPRANHLFLEARTGARDEYPGLSRFVPGYFDRMAQWLRAKAR